MDQTNGSQLAFFVRVANLLIYLLLFVGAIVFLTSDNAWVNIMISLYLMIFAIVLVILELRKMPDFLEASIKSEMGFLLHPKGRMVFMIAISLIMFGEGNLGIAIGCLLIALMAMNGLMLWKFPEEFLSTYNIDSGDAYASSTSDGSFKPPLNEEESKLTDRGDYRDERALSEEGGIGGTEV